MNARRQRDIDRETIYVDGPVSPELQDYIDAPVVWRVVGREELDKLNNNRRFSLPPDYT